MAKKTVEQLEAAARAAEERAKKLRAQAKKQTQAEQAKENAELVKAVRAWGETYKGGQYKDNLVQLFRDWAARNAGN